MTPYVSSRLIVTAEARTAPFVTNILTMTPDSGYMLTSYRVKGLHPKGRIYVTDVPITDGGGQRSATATGCL